jgi:hypothetical protein
MCTLGTLDSASLKSYTHEISLLRFQKFDSVDGTANKRHRPR